MSNRSIMDINPPTPQELKRITTDDLPGDFYITPDRKQIRIEYGEYNWSIASTAGWHINYKHQQEPGMSELLDKLQISIQYWRSKNKEHWIVLGRLSKRDYSWTLQGIYPSKKDAIKGTKAFNFIQREYVQIELPAPDVISTSTYYFPLTD